MKRHLLEAFVIAIVLTTASYVIAYLVAGPASPPSWLEIVGVSTGYACTWLCVRQRRINYPLGALSSAALAVLFWQNDLVASAVLNAYLTPALLYGWIRWRRDSVTRPVGHVELRWIPVYLGATFLAYMGAGAIANLLGAPMAWIDSIILVGTILAQFLLDNKKIETWYVWVVVNVAAIWTYTSQGLWLAAMQFLFFLLNTAVGYYFWRRDLNAQSVHVNDSYAANHGSSAADPVR